MEPIPELQFHFDCTRCDNFTFCQKCYKANKTHTHRFKKQKVALGHGPPANSSELIAKAFMQCYECGKSLIDLSKRVYVCEKSTQEEIESGDGRYWCKNCYETTEYEHKRIKLKPGMNEKKSGEEEENGETRRFLDNLFDDYHKLECEDVIGSGQIKTRFSYQNVAKEDFGLTEEEIFLMDDKALNQLVSIKHYRPFRHTA